MASTGPDASTAELRALLRSGPRAPGRSAAFIELVSREPRGLNRTLAALALDPEIDQELRVKAVAALGRNASPSSLAALRSAVAVDDTVVAQRAIERLGKTGAPEDLELLRQVRTGNRTTQRALRTAKVFLSYRHRLGAYRNDVPKRRLPAGAGDAQPVAIGPPNKAMTHRLGVRPPTVPGLRLAARPSQRLVCGANDLALMMNEDVLGAGVETLAVVQGIPAVVVRENPETGGFDPAYYLMTDPIRTGRFRILGVRGSGRIALGGEGNVDGATATFEVNATENPLDHPLTVRGTWDSAGGVRFDLALVDDRFSDAQQRRRRQPRLVDAPERPPSTGR